MNRFIYIQKDTKSIYVEFDNKLDEKIFKTGATWDDYASGAWVLLSDSQLAFRDANPGASVQEVFNMQLTPVPEPPPRTIEQARLEKISEITSYDYNVVNQFKIKMQGMEISHWFDAQERSKYNTSIVARRMLIAKGVISDQTMQLPVAGQIVTLQIDDAELMLAQLQMYADCAQVATEVHKSTVEQLNDIAAVDAYDCTKGYPEMLTFNL
jgi:uncharacterized protein YacL (UPF0231 family)